MAASDAGKAYSALCENLAREADTLRKSLASLETAIVTMPDDFVTTSLIDKTQALDRADQTLRDLSRILRRLGDAGPAFPIDVYSNIDQEALRRRLSGSDTPLTNLPAGGVEIF
ncbi:hypothetical protein [Jannaschia aquimarina]|uniref:Uncharacterized protein n=2 Tax=Jannaschia aquimarina TaxID=935700 RepID=A0A0D1CTS0_9RHOB|nr:hypothetical protein [Jannaschia aquimarina]KIT18172.1 hypothetical protein jaqu_00350 [Jannaschia aquimarina]SNT40472.1 hypothetical protein SAMN05421775_11560 [Jannaschia aquimarina]